MRVLDLETKPFERALLVPPPVCAQWTSPTGPRLELIADARAEIEAMVYGSEKLIGTFIAFDMAVIGEHWPDLLPAIFAKYNRNEIEDVILNQKILDIAARGGAEEFSMEDLCRRWDLPLPDKATTWRKEFWSLRDVQVKYWPAGAVSYCLDDVDLPARVAALQYEYAADWERRSGHPLLHLAGREARKQFVLYLASAWGFRTNPSRVALLRENVDKILTEGKAKLQGEGLVRGDGSRDTKKAAARMVAIMGARGLPVPKTEKDGVCLDKEACEASADDLLMAYSEYSQAKTLYARVDDLSEGVYLPLQTRFNSLLETSRTSSSKPKPPIVGAQTQNFPRKAGAREALEPRAGYVYVIGDLPTAELHSLAQVCYDAFGYSVMGDQLNAGRDLHLWFGAQILGLEYEEALKRKAEKELKDARQAAKPCNFGFPGGMGIANFIGYAYATYRVRLEFARAEALKRKWLAAFPEMADFFKWIDAKFRGRDRTLIRHLRSGRWRGRVTYCQACNSQFQELTATAASDGLCDASHRCYVEKGSALFGSRPILYTHDEVVLETPEEMAHDAAMELGAVMTDAFNYWHPTYPIEGVECAVSRIYSKDVQAVRGPNGRLVPWEGKKAA